MVSFATVVTALVTVSNSTGEALSTSAPSKSTHAARQNDLVIIDVFNHMQLNQLGLSHESTVGSFEQDQTGGFYLNAFTNNVDSYFSTTLGNGCFDMRMYKGSYLHLTFSGSREFTISLQQNNRDCDSKKTPFPEAWDSIEASRYTFERSEADRLSNRTEYEIYVPISHFNVDLQRIVSVTLEGFYTQTPTYVHSIGIVNKAGHQSPDKLPTGTVFKTCTKPGLIAFGIDDGSPRLAQEFMQVIKDAKIPVTFFVSGKALDDMASNFTNIYKEMHGLGHQIALHSYDHFKLEALKEDSEIDWQFQMSIEALQKHLQLKSKYFRPPFGTLGARTRQSLAKHVEDPNIVLWSIDVEDWKQENLNTPGSQLAAFERQLDLGGDIVVMHYLHNSTVLEMKDMIRLAASRGKRFVTIEECLEG